MAEKTIPLPVIPVVANALTHVYSESGLRGLFIAAGIELPGGPKMAKLQLCMACLGWANKHLPEPIATLGGLIGDFMDRRLPLDDSITEHQKRVTASLLNSGYKYVRGGQITAPGMRTIKELTNVIGGAQRQTSTPEEAQTLGSGDLHTAVLPENPLRQVTTTKEDTTEVRMTRDPRATLFIGSTVEALSIARAVHTELDHDLEVTIWNHGLFVPGATTWSQLPKMTEQFDFALFVFSGDDNVQSRGEASAAVRDNVLIEFGLFVGALGHARVFFMFNRDARPKLASDLAGVTALTYSDRTDKNLQAAVSPAANQIRQAAERLGRRSSPNP